MLPSEKCSPPFYARATTARRQRPSELPIRRRGGEEGGRRALYNGRLAAGARPGALAPPATSPGWGVSGAVLYLFRSRRYLSEPTIPIAGDAISAPRRRLKYAIEALRRSAMAPLPRRCIPYTKVAQVRDWVGGKPIRSILARAAEFRGGGIKTLAKRYPPTFLTRLTKCAPQKSRAPFG